MAEKDFTGVWQIPPPPYSEVDPVVARPQEVLIAFGGWDGDNALNTVEMFDPSQGQWTTLPNMPERRRDHGAAVLGDWVYLVGGWDRQPYYSSVTRFNHKSHSWLACAPLSGPRGWPGVAVLDGKIYCVGGYDAKEKAVKTVERYEPSKDKWEKVASLNTARGGCGLVALGGCLYAVGGYDGDRALKSVERLQPEDNKWREVQGLGGRREDLSHSTVVFNNNILVMGGVDDKEEVLKTGELYDPNRDSWSPMQANLMREKRGLGLAVVGGVLYGVGGEDRNDENLDMVQMFDTVTGAWQPWHNMRGGRAGHAVAVVRQDPLNIGGGGFVVPSQAPPPYSAVQ